MLIIHQLCNSLLQQLTAPQSYYDNLIHELDPIQPHPYNESELSTQQLQVLTDKNKCYGDNVFCMSDLLEMFALTKCRNLTYGEIGRVCWDEVWTSDNFDYIGSSYDVAKLRYNILLDEEQQQQLLLQE